uniref:Uncharacterized protein n=1 Tax=viral metagenome TaxID=1070528 RepID=A0A6C0H265_9ZZZZ
MPRGALKSTSKLVKKKPICLKTNWIASTPSTVGGCVLFHPVKDEGTSLRTQWGNFTAQAVGWIGWTP